MLRKEKETAEETFLWCSIILQSIIYHEMESCPTGVFEIVFVAPHTNIFNVVKRDKKSRSVTIMHSIPTGPPTHCFSLGEKLEPLHPICSAVAPHSLRLDGVYAALVR